MITDRTDSDTYYNYTDLNRVESKTKELAEKLSKSGYFVMIKTKTDWSMDNFPSASEMKRYLDNVKALKNQFTLSYGELPESMDNLDYIGANEIEKFLMDVEKLIDYMLEALHFCGVFYCGEE